MTAEDPDASFQAIFTGRRGRLLVGLLLAEFAAAAQGIAYSTVLPLASAELHGANLYGATLAASTLSTILVLAVGSRWASALGAKLTLLVATAVFVAGVLFSALAPSMPWVLAGSVLRGLAAGLLAAFGLTAIGGLYNDAERPRVLAMYAVIWLLPSILGPPLNAVIAVAWGWRWTMAWPVILIIAARLLVARDADVIPWSRDGARIDPVGGLTVVAGLAVATAASGTRATWWSVGLVTVGCLVATIAGIRTLRVLGHGAHLRLLVVFAGLAVAFFGGISLIPLMVIDALGHGVVAGSIALGAGLLAWSVAGLVHATLPRAVAIGLSLVPIGLFIAAALLTEVLDRWPTLVGVVVASGVAGTGVGLSYPRLSSGAFDRLDPNWVNGMAAAVAFAEITGTALGSLVGGGSYSMTVTAGGSARLGVAIGLVLSGLFGVVTTALWVSRRTVARTGERLG